MYYVYEFYIVDTGEIIYAGKGTGYRYKVRSQRNKVLTEMLGRYNCDSRIVKEFDDEKDAFDFEFEYINKLKETGQCVCNIYSGGAGGSGEWWTDELRDQYSRHNVMKSFAQRERMREHNPMKDPEVAEKTNGQKRRPVVIGGKEYSSVTQARDELGVAIDTVILWCRKGVNADGETCYYKDEGPKTYTGKRYNKGSCKAIEYLGRTYESPVDLAEELGCNVATIYSWAQRGFSPDGMPCRYVGDERALEFENRHTKRNIARSKAIVINGTSYNTCGDASRALGIPKSTIYSWLQGVKHNPNFICKYARTV